MPRPASVRDPLLRLVGGGSLLFQLPPSAEEETMCVRQNKAAEYRRQAVVCAEVARRLSVREDRERMMEMAQQWLALAEEAETTPEMS
jgi:hypothetical protein